MSNLPIKIFSGKPFPHRRSYAESTVVGRLRKAIRVLVRSIYFTNSAIWYEAGLCSDISAQVLKATIALEKVPVAEFGKWAINHFYPDRAIGDKLINELRSAKQNGHIYIWAKHREETAGYLKIGIRKVYIHDYRSSILTPLHTAIIYDTYVVDKFRCKGIASNLICDGMRLMRQKGYLRIRCHIPPSNTASVRAYEKCGFHSKAHIRFHRIMGRSFFSSNNNTFSQSTLPGCLH